MLSRAFLTRRIGSSLTLKIVCSAQAAQATTILVSTQIFELHLSFVNFLGVAFVLAGGVLYARYEAMDDDERSSNGNGTSHRDGGYMMSGENSLLPMKVKRDDPLPAEPSATGENGFASWWTGESKLSGSSPSGKG